MSFQLSANKRFLSAPDATLLGGAREFPYIIQSPMYELTSGIVFATKTLLALSVSSSGYAFNTSNLQAVKRRKQLPTVKPR